MISKEKKAEIIKTYGRTPEDTGSPEVQIGRLCIDCTTGFLLLHIIWFHDIIIQIVCRRFPRLLKR